MDADAYADGRHSNINITSSLPLHHSNSNRQQPTQQTLPPINIAPIAAALISNSKWETNKQTEPAVPTCPPDAAAAATNSNISGTLPTTFNNSQV